MIMRITQDDPALPKCYFSHSTIPKYTDQARPPTKQQPFKAFLQHAPVHTVDLILPNELCVLVESKLKEKSFSYARVFMPLHDVVTGDFFNQYVKAGNIVMLSEGTPGIQNTFKLKDGVLTIDIDKATYERCGLEGTVASSPDRTHVKSRFKIELDLKLPSMQHGKKGFERVKWAAKNVLTDSLAWLFVDLESEDMTSGPIATLHPQVMQMTPTISRLTEVVPPFVHSQETIQDQLYEEQLLEWLGLVTLGSPRISEHESIDSYLCKYTLPEAFEDENKRSQSLIHIRWHGFGSAIFLRHIWLILRHATRERDDSWYAAERKTLDDKGVTWFSLSAKTFEDTSFMALCYDHKSVMLWESD